jgi:biotin carboxylase
VLEIASNLKANLVISACIDQTLPIACYVAEKLKLPSPFSYETALNATNKCYMKKQMTRTGIPTSRFVAIDSVAAVDKIDLEFPLMVKPTDSHGSFGVRKVNTKDELKQFAVAALRISRSGSAIVEEYRQGMEVSVDAYVGDTDTRVLMWANIRKKRISSNINLIFQTIIPAPISPKAVERIGEVVRDLAAAFALKNTPILVQTIVNQDQVNVIEFAPRIGGGSKHKTIRRVTGFDVLNALVDSFLGIRPKLEFSSNGKCFSRSHIYALPGKFGRVQNVDRLLANGVIEEFNLFKTPGMDIGENFASKDRVGSFLVSADSLDALLRKIGTAVDSLEVFDLAERPIMRKDIFEGPHL